MANTNFLIPFPVSDFFLKNKGKIFRTDSEILHRIIPDNAAELVFFLIKWNIQLFLQTETRGCISENKRESLSLLYIARKSVLHSQDYVFFLKN